MPIRANTRT
ncbi:hypothetical protein YPPY09_2167, partial [Yersinia pestis PY-09]